MMKCPWKEDRDVDFILSLREEETFRELLQRVKTLLCKGRRYALLLPFVPIMQGRRHDTAHKDSTPTR